MLKVLLDWLQENYPVVLLCVFVGVGVWFVTRFYFKRFVKMEETVGKLPCKNHLEEIQSLKSSIGKLDSICEQLSEVTKWIMKPDPAEIDFLAPKFSPRKMTDAGLHLYDISGARQTVDENADTFIDIIHSENPQTPLDVEDKAYLVLLGRLAEPIFNNIKNFIYYQPEKITLKGENESDMKVTLSLGLLLRLMSIDLRDRYLQKYPIQRN